MPEFPKSGIIRRAGGPLTVPPSLAGVPRTVPIVRAPQRRRPSHGTPVCSFSRTFDHPTGWRSSHVSPLSCGGMTSGGCLQTKAVKPDRHAMIKRVTATNESPCWGRRKRASCRRHFSSSAVGSRVGCPRLMANGPSLALENLCRTPLDCRRAYPEIACPRCCLDLDAGEGVATVVGAHGSHAARGHDTYGGMLQFGDQFPRDVGRVAEG